MAFNFPDSPTPGQNFEPVPGLIYTFTDTVWKVQSIAAALDGKVDRSGDTMTGDLEIEKANPALILNKAASGENVYVAGQTLSLSRWLVIPGDNATEAGGNSGSNFGIFNCSDAGAVLGNPIYIYRNTGQTYFNQPPISAGVPSAGNQLVTKTYVDAQVANFFPTTGGTLTGRLVVQAPSDYASYGAIEIQYAGDQLVTFHRPNGFAINLGLRTDNNFYLGGFSEGVDGHRWISYDSGLFVAQGDVTAFSDARLKEDVRTVTDALERVRNMRGVWFKHRKNGTEGAGAIAQELQKVAPELVHEADGYLAVAYGNAFAYFVEAIKEMAERIEELEAA